MKTNLFINFYVDANAKRHREIVCCLLDNIKNRAIDTISLSVSRECLENLSKVLHGNNLTDEEKTKVSLLVSDKRPTYNDYFELTQQHPDDINIIANTDITMDYLALERLKRWNWRGYCLALSRWDFLNDGMEQHYTRHYDHRDSQDTWILKGAFKSIPEADFCLGKRGCDNRIAYLLSRHYHVINPSIDIKTYHYHITGIRNYCMKTNDDVVKPPYKLLIPTILPR